MVNCAGSPRGRGTSADSPFSINTDRSQKLWYLTGGCEFVTLPAVTIVSLMCPCLLGFPWFREVVKKSVQEFEKSFNRMRFDMMKIFLGTLMVMSVILSMMLGTLFTFFVYQVGYLIHITCNIRYLIHITCYGYY